MRPNPIRRHIPKNIRKRRWRGYNVDIHLKLDWLESLNGLKAFDLRSICEGHPNSADLDKNGPHIIISLNSDLEVLFADKWPTCQKMIKEGIDNVVFHPLTYVYFDFCNHYSRSNNRSYLHREIYLMLHLNLKKCRRITESSRNEWFTANVKAIEEFNKFICDLLGTR